MRRRRPWRCGKRCGRSIRNRALQPANCRRVLPQQRWLLRLFGIMFSTFAVIALALAAVGLYAVTAYTVTQYTRDIGVRMVLGAKPGQVVWLFLRRAFIQLSIGLAIGLGGAFGVGSCSRGFWFRPAVATR